MRAGESEGKDPIADIAVAMIWERIKTGSLRPLPERQRPHGG